MKQTFSTALLQSNTGRKSAEYPPDTELRTEAFRLARTGHMVEPILRH
jgi:hypothetical protein